MLDGSAKRTFNSGPGGPAGATTAAALTDVVAAIKAVLQQPDVPSVRTALGLAIGTNVQAWDADLDAIAAQGTAAFGRSLLAGGDAATVRGLLALGSAAVLAAGLPGGAATLDGSTGKLLAAQIPDALLGALRYQGGWNASTNTPALPTPATANKGFYYIVTVAGSTSQPGPAGAITDWQIGDWAVSDGTYWEKVDSSDQVVSVAGLQGTITAAALKAALAIASTDITDATTLGKALLTAANAAAALTSLGAVAASAPAGTLKANLSGSTAAVTDATFTALLDAIFGAGVARGAILVRGVSTWGGLALGGNGQTLQSNGTDLVFAASAPGTGAVRYDAAQTLGTPQQRQALANVGAASGVRQTVQSGPASSGAPSFLPASTSGTLAMAMQGLGTGTPLITSIAAGFDAAGPIDIVSAITSNLSQTLAASSTLALYIDVGTTSTPTPSFGAGTLFPIYQFGGTISTVSGQYTFDTQAMQGWLGNGSAAVKCNRVYVGEAVTSSTAVTSTIAYAYNGVFESAWTATLPAASTTTVVSHNLGCQPGRKILVAENTATELGYAVGDQVDTTSGLASQNGAPAPIPPGMGSTRNTLTLVTSNTTGWIVISRTDYSTGAITRANWRYRFRVARTWGGAA